MLALPAATFPAGAAPSNLLCVPADAWREMQERLGCLMYATNSTRPDIAYPVHKLCQCLLKPTPDLIRETDHIFASIGDDPENFFLMPAPHNVRFSQQCRQSFKEKFCAGAWEAVGYFVARVQAMQRKYGRY